MGERRFAGARRRAAADQRRGRRRVMRRAQHALAPARRAEGAGDAQDRRRLERFVVRQRRQQAGETARQHRLAGARRADHQDAQLPGRGDLEGALGGALAAHVDEIVERSASPGVAADEAGAARSRRRRRPGGGHGRRRAGDRRRARRGRRPGPTRRRWPAAGRGCAASSPASVAGRAPSPARRAPVAAGRRARARRRTRSASSRAASIWPAAARMPRAIGRSKRPDSLGRSAGARLTVTRLLCGNSRPLVCNAARTRSRDSLTSVSARPTSVKLGRPLARCTSTVTAGESRPRRARLWTRAKVIRTILRRSPCARLAQKRALDGRARPWLGAFMKVIVPRALRLGALTQTRLWHATCETRLDLNKVPEIS